MKDETQNKKILKEQYEESLFAVLMDEFAEAEGQRLIKENERLKNDMDFKLPDGLEARCEKTIRNTISEKKRKDVGLKVLKVLGKVAVFALACGVTFAVLFNTVSAFRISVWNILRQVDSQNTNITINDTGEQTSENGSITIPTGSYLPTWVPNGYELMSYSNTENVVTAVFSNSEDNLIYYFEFGNGQVLGVNTNNADMSKDVEINGLEGLLIVNNGVTSVTWADVKRNLISRISARGLDEDTVIKIAQSVKT
ncbi:MAG: hypothetical protein CVU91_07560 [Firmicutes bacterium HGW-Firmicutes-16]|nr:MAG: hypothetical protein CVU91_07560 [Firmicutes bacterium HGW-Firmicutes-16]